MKWFRWYLVIVSLVFLCGCPPLDCPVDPGSEGATLGAIGDSIMAGGGCRCRSYRTEGWVSIPYSGMPVNLAESLGIPVANWAIGGAVVGKEGPLTIPGQLASLITNKPTVNLLLVTCGVNDVLYAERVGELDSNKVEDIISAIDSLYTTISDNEMEAIVHTLPYFQYVPSNVTVEGLVRINNAITIINVEVKNMAYDYSFECYDLNQFLADNPLYYADSIHLTCDGYEAWALEMLSYFM